MISSTEMIKQAGCTYRQLDYWIRGGIIRPRVDTRGSGSARGFDPEQVRVLRAVTALAALGADRPVLKTAAGHLEELPEEEWRGYVFIDIDGDIYREGIGSARVLDLEACSGRMLVPA